MFKVLLIYRSIFNHIMSVTYYAFIGYSMSHMIMKHIKFKAIFNLFASTLLLFTSHPSQPSFPKDIYKKIT